MKYWCATTKDGNKWTEADSKNWNDIKDNVEHLELRYNGQIISLPDNMEEYTQAKTASADLGGGNVTIESRYISFKLGSNTIRVRVNEKDGNVSVEVD